MGSWQEYVNGKYKKSESKQSYAEHVKEKYGKAEEKKEATVKKTDSSALKYVGWGSKAQPYSVKRVTAEEAARKRREDWENSEKLQRLQSLYLRCICISASRSGEYDRAASGCQPVRRLVV